MKNIRSGKTLTILLVIIFIVLAGACIQLNQISSKFDVLYSFDEKVLDMNNQILQLESRIQELENQMDGIK